MSTTYMQAARQFHKSVHAILLDVGLHVRNIYIHRTQTQGKYIYGQNHCSFRNEICDREQLGYNTN